MFFIILSLIIFIQLSVSASVSSSHEITDQIDQGNSIISTSKAIVEPVIINGTNASLIETPWIVSIHVKGKFMCGGSIISRYTVLTAAHCLYGVDNLKPEDIHVRYNSIRHDFGGSLVNVSRFLWPASYNDATLNDDIALLILSDYIVINGYTTKKVTLPYRDTEPAEGQTVLSAGWGDTANNGLASKYIQKVYLKIINKYTCRDIYDDFTEHMCCAGAPGKDSCQGDSGGPLVEYPGELQVGIVSYGGPLKCADPKFPGVYTVVSKLKDWILRYMR